METDKKNLTLVTHNEETRIQNLKDFKFDIPTETTFDRLTSLAARIFSVPICLISVLDEDRQWLKTENGLSAPETLRILTFCSYVIMEESPDVVVVNDALLDQRFKDNDLVTGPPGIRFYAGAPLLLGNIKIGTISIIDTVPRMFTLEDKMLLIDMSSMVVSQIQLRNELNQTHRSYHSSTSHNLRTPLASLVLCLEVLSKDKIINPLDSNVLEESNINLEIMKWTVEKGLSAARYHLALAPLVPDIKCFEIEDLISKLQKATALIKKVPIYFHLNDCPKESTTDKNAIFYSLLDLLTNACEHTKEGRIDVIFELIQNQKTYIKVTVKDTGDGVSEELKNNLFVQPFLGITKSGIGCYGVRINMELVNGSYGYLENHPKGSIFWIEYPDSFLSRKYKAQKPRKIAAFPNKNAYKKASILVVDDCVTIRHMMQKLLQNSYLVDTAENGKEGLEALKRTQYKIAFVDFLMPVMLGMECVSLYRKWEAKNRNVETVVVGISANAEESEVEEALRSGMNYFVKKPLSITIIQEIIKKTDSKDGKLIIKQKEELKGYSKKEKKFTNLGTKYIHTTDFYKNLSKLLFVLLLLSAILIFNLL